jgi:hypothetical protein
MSMLRRPDDHRREIRRRAARAVFIAEPDQDRHLMIGVALLSASQPGFFPPPAARRSRKALRSQAPHALYKRRACVRREQDPSQKARRPRSRRELSPPPAPEAP